MVIAVLIGLFLLYYAVIVVSLFKSEGFSFISLLIDIGIVTGLIAIYFISGNLFGHDLSNIYFFTINGSFVYMYFAIKYFWIKPKLLQYIIQKEHGETEAEMEAADELEVDLQTSRIRSIYYVIIAIVLLIISKVRMVPELKADALSMNPVYIFLGIIIIFIWLIIDIYRKKKYGIFLFKTFVPLVVTIWIIIATIILQ
ncbi:MULTISPECIES: DUF5080 family protein [Staphylococcus]|uniref:DUF5080 family protein n=1 Tax=Staphylococcus hsinchuensis TaxID=3051183 RepID=A0ABZ3EET1_9STAP|nr:DUF5080 family protein [Staphylococcus sp. Marseille-Q6910]